MKNKKCKVCGKESVGLNINGACPDCTHGFCYLVSRMTSIENSTDAKTIAEAGPNIQAMAQFISEEAGCECPMSIAAVVYFMVKKEGFCEHLRSVFNGISTE